MAEATEQSIQFKDQGSGACGEAVMRLNRYTSQEARLRAIKRLCLFWLIAAVCVLIPIAHFILVPAFFLGGIVTASRLWRCLAEGIDACGDCPACRNAVTIDLEKSAELPQWRNCPQCGASLELSSRE